MTLDSKLRVQPIRYLTRIAAGVLLTAVLVGCYASQATAQWTTNGNNINNTNSGNVGIGTSTPEHGLHVDGDVVLSTGTISGFKFRDRGNVATDNWVWYSTGNVARLYRQGPGDLLGITQTGNFGVGTMTPGGRLEVKAAAGTHNSLILNTSSTGYADSLVFQEAGAAKASIQHNPGVLAGGLLFNTNGLASPANTRMVIDITGNVGIGTTSPTAKLNVNGNTKVIGNIDVTGTGNITAAGTIEAGNIKAKYQDVAEWVPSTHALPAGTVVTLDPTKSNHVEASSRSYDTRVAGVISAQPGIALGEEGDNKVLVATTGRVKIKVDAAHGPIQVGDLLVTSSVPGVAMKSQPIDVGGVQIHRPVTLIGKALEPLAKGQGEILVLLSLQ